MIQFHAVLFPPKDEETSSTRRSEPAPETPSLRWAILFSAAVVSVGAATILSLHFL